MTLDKGTRGDYEAEIRQGEKWIDEMWKKDLFLSLFTGFGEDFSVSWRPSDGRNVYCKSRFLELSGFYMLFDQLGRYTNHMLAFPVLNHVHCL